MASADRSTLFINATVLDGSEHMEPQPDMAVTVERGVITWMGPSAVAQAPAGACATALGPIHVMTPRSTVTAISGCGSICSEPSRTVALINNVERSADAISSSSPSENLNICPLLSSVARLPQTYRLTEGRGDVGDGIRCSPTPPTTGKCLDL